jgi:hypothetical protein
MAIRKFNGGEKILIKDQVYKVCKSGHDTSDGKHTYYKAARGSNIQYVRSDRAVMA